MKLQKWDRKEVHRLEGVLAKRQALFENIDAEADRLRARRQRAMRAAEANLAAARERAARRAKDVEP